MYSGAASLKDGPMKNSPLFHVATRNRRRLTVMVAFLALLAASPGQVSHAVAQTPASAESTGQMAVRLGTHPDYTRLVFDFPTLTAYTAETAANGQTRLLFSTPLAASAMPAPGGVVSAISSQRAGGDALAVTLTHPPGANVKHYRLMRRVVVDVFPAGAPSTQTATATPPPRPRPGLTPAPPIDADPLVNAAPKPQPAPTKPTPSPLREQAAPVVESAATPPELKLPVDPSIVVDKVDTNDAPLESSEAIPPTTITLSTVEPTKLAVFQRDDVLWLVTEGKASSAAEPQIAGPDSAQLADPKVLTFEGGRAYRYTLPPGREIAVNRKSLMWEITLGRNLKKSPPDVHVTVNQDSATAKARLLVDLKDPGKILSIEDPVVGDRLMVVPVTSPRDRVEDLHRYANVELLPADAGLVVRALADDIRVLRLGDYVTISAPDGIAATPGASASPALIDTTSSFASGEARRLFDFPNWLQGGKARLNENRRVIEKQVADARSPQGRQEALLKLALLYFANNFGHETLGVLRMIMAEDPEMALNPNIIALRGAAAALAGHFDDALKDLSTPAIQQHPEVNLWIGYAAAATEQWRRADQAFPRTNELLSEYPPDIALPMTIYMAESALRLGHVDAARTLLDTVADMPIGEQPHHEAAIDYLRGEAARQDGRFAEAIAIWEPVANGLDRLYHAKASLALTLLEVQEKKIPLSEAVERLDSLRFAWRGDGLEVQTLATLGRMKILNGQYLEGLKELDRAATQAERLSDDSTPFRSEMAQTVQTLFTGDARKKINPLEAVSVYSEYEELLPEGEAGSVAALNFADYLVSMDLLDRAAGLMNRALQDTSDPANRAEIGARLAAVYLIDGKPSLAQDALDRTVGAAPAEVAERRTLLKARAQSQLNLTAEAVATLAPLKTEAARRLSADVLWRARRWGEAAAAIETLLPTTVPARLDDDTARLVMNAAVGYKLAGDSARLAAVRQRYAALMSGTTFGPTFTVVTRDGGSATLSDRDTILRVASEVDMFRPLLDSYKASKQVPTPAANAGPATPLPTGTDGTNANDGG